MTEAEENLQIKYTKKLVDPNRGDFLSVLSSHDAAEKPLHN